jgi:hypothetical protein
MKSNLSHHPEAIAKRLTRLFALTTESERGAGEAWYWRATDTIDALAAEFGHDRATVAAVVAVLSPQTPWDRNIRGARLILDAHASGDDWRSCASASVYNANVRKAFRVLDGDSSALRGPKVEAFAANLRGDLDYVTLDVWAIRAAIRADLPGRHRDAIARGYRLAAARAGISPAEFQAIIWVKVRGKAD